MTDTERAHAVVDAVCRTFSRGDLARDLHATCTAEGWLPERAFAEAQCIVREACGLAPIALDAPIEPPRDHAQRRAAVAEAVARRRGVALIDSTHRDRPLLAGGRNE
jgi:hypothetical protein